MSEKTTTYGPYELTGDANSLTVGNDPVAFLEAGKPYTTTDPAVARLLDEHPHVTKSSPKAARKAG